MDPQQELVQQARILTKDKRQSILMGFSEIQLHKHLKSLFDQMEPNYRTAITHGVNELGKDLVIVKKDSLGVDVTAVVVKKGDIKGKTAGGVDEIKEEVKVILGANARKQLEEIASQVDQALAHPAQIGSIFSELPVNKVMVVVAGEFSQNARTRLVGEVQIKMADIYDVDWLIDKFTNYYPQIFFEQEVVDYIQEQIRRLEEKHWLGRKHISLSDYYVEPILMKAIKLDKLTSKTIDAVSKRERISLSDLRESIKSNTYLLLAGEPSSGKSGALAKLAIQMFREASGEIVDGHESKGQISVPILVTAREVLDADSEVTLLGSVMNVPELRGRIRVRVLMVDGLDEVPSSNRQNALDKAIQFAKLLNTSLLITSRNIALLENVPKNFTRYNLLPFQMSQAIKMFEKLIGKNKEKLDALKVGLEKFQFKVPMVPLSLIFLLELVEEKKEVPASVTELYDRFSDIALGRHDKEKGIEVLFDYLIKKRFLAALAYTALLSKEKLEISREEFNAFLLSYAAEYGWDNDYVQHFAKEIERTGILQLTESVMFKHRSFLDYFCAFFIHDQHETIGNVHDFLVKIIFDDNWGDSGFFSIGMKREFPEGMLEKFFNFPKDDISGSLIKFGVGRLLQAGWHSKASVMTKGIERGLTFGSHVRKQLSEAKDNDGKHIPPLLADVFLLGTAELSYVSGFLFKDLRSLFDKYLSSPSEDNLLYGLIILFTIRDLLLPAEKSQLVKKYIEVLDEHGSIETQARAMIFFSIIKKEDKPFLKKLRSRTERMAKKYPALMKKMALGGK